MSPRTFILFGGLALAVACKAAEQRNPSDKSVETKALSTAAASKPLAADATNALNPSAGTATVPAVAVPEGSKLASHAGLHFVVPQSWQTKPPANAMRLAEYEIDQGAEPLTLVLFRFPGGGGGGAQANLDRWIEQFVQPDGSSSKDKAIIEHQQKNGLKVATLDVSGNYHPAAMPGQAAQPIDHARMLAAVVEVPGGGPIFLKLAGPADAVAKVVDDWKKLVQSLALALP